MKQHSANIAIHDVHCTLYMPPIAVMQSIDERSELCQCIWLTNIWHV